MKRHFLTGLKAFAVGALAFAAVSCYDDQPIWDEIEGLKDRVTALEEKLNTEVATINTTLGTLKAADEKLAADIAAVVADVKKVNETLTTLDAYDKTLDGKIADLNAALAAFEDEASKQLAAAIAQIAVVKAEKNEAGNYVLTFADGKTLEVAAADANANNTGVITTVEVDGVTYWAVIGADGKTKVLDAAVHPDTKLQFKVDPETNELLVAYDGKTWEQTGVIVNDDTTFNVVTDFEDGEDYVTITVGGEEYQLPKYVADEAVLDFGRGKAFFMYGATKTFYLDMEDIEECYVMSKPDGWKATLDEVELKVIAPAAGLIEAGAAELSGEVLIHATTLTGACKVVKLDVTTGEAMKLSYTDGTVNLWTAYTAEQTNFFGETYFDFVSLCIGVTPMDEYLTFNSFEDFIQTKDFDSSFGDVLNIAYNNSYIEQNWYEDGVCEDITISIPLDSLVAAYNMYAEVPFELEEDELYAVWVFPNTDPINYNEALCTFTGNHIEFEVVDSVYNDVTFAANLVGADGYAIGALDKSVFDEWVKQENDPEYTHEDALEEYLVGSYMPGPFGKFTSGNKTAMGEIYPVGEQTIKLSEVTLSDMMSGISGDVTPDTEYFVWILPYYNDKPAADYTVEDIIVNVCKTEPLVKNDAVKATVTVTPGSLSVKYTITPPTGGNVMFEVIPATEFEETFMVEGVLDEAAVKEYFSWGYPYDEVVSETQEWGIKPETDYVILTYSTANGYYAIGMTEFTTYTCEVPLNKQYTYFSEDYGMNRIMDFCMTTDNVLYAGVDYDEMVKLYEMPEEYIDQTLVGKIQGQEKYENVVVTPTSETAGRITMSVTSTPLYADEPMTVNYLILYSEFTETSIKLYSPSQFEGDDAAYSGIGLCEFDESYNTFPVELTLVENPKEVVFQDNGGIAM